jgi:hypothetical protein
LILSDLEEAMSFFSLMRGARHRSDEPAEPEKLTIALASTPQKVIPDLVYIPMEPDAIADAVICLRITNDRANELCAEADLMLKRHECDLRRLRERNSELESLNKNLQNTNKKLHGTITQLNSSVNKNAAQLSQTQRALKLEQEKCKALQTEILGARMEARKVKFGDLYDGKICTFSCLVYIRSTWSAC